MREAVAGDNPRWLDESKCHWSLPGAPTPAFFYPTDGAGANRAAAYCRGLVDGVECPVRMQCLGLAIETNEVFGVWGGWGQRDRVRIRKVWKMTGTIRDLPEDATIVFPPRRAAPRETKADE